jgi:hypothetical protein
MSITNILDTFPLWGIFLLSLLVTFLPLEFGFLMGRHRQGRLTGEEKVFTGPVVAASFSLLAFMLAMTFGTVVSRFNEIKGVAVDEANAISTAFIRADLLPDAERAEVRQLLQDYVDLRVKAVQSDVEEHVKEAIDKSEKLQGDLWSRATEVAERHPTPISALFVQSMNEVIDTHAKRITLVIRYRLPETIWMVLYGLAILAMAMGGYDIGLSGSRGTASITLAAALAFSVVFTLVIALDRPHQNLSTATQAVMIDLQEDIRRSMRDAKNITVGQP